jgi:hypothetical protein
MVTRMTMSGEKMTRSRTTHGSAKKYLPGERLDC